MIKTTLTLLFLVIYGASFGQTCIGSNATGTHNNCYLNTSKQANINLLSVDSVITGKWYGSTIDIQYGGTGGTTSTSALNNLLPSQSGNTNKTLISDGTNTTWESHPGTTNFTSYASGTAYALTTTMQKVDFGTTDPTITISSAGTYLLFVTSELIYNNATDPTSKLATLKIRRINNTPSDITNSIITFTTRSPIINYVATLSHSAFPAVLYTTSNADDTLEIWGSIDSTLNSGTIDVEEASIVAIKLY